MVAVNSNMTTFRPNTNKEKFSFTGSGQATVQRTNDISQATKIETVTGETLTLAAGGAGTTGKVSTTYGPITDSLGRKLGYFNTSTDSDTSVSITHLALAGDEVRFDEYLTDTELYALLDNGDYTIDYTNAIIYYKKGTADTAGTINYKYTSQEIDLSGSTITIGAVDAQGQYNATEPSLSDGDKSILQLNEVGELKVTGGAGASSVSAEFVSPSDFTATYTSSSTITLSGVPFTISNSSQIAYIKQIKSDNTSLTYVNGANDTTLTVSSNVVTVYSKGVAVTSLASGDVYEVGLNSQRKAYDASTNSTMVSPLKNVWNQYTDAETLVTAQDLTASYADFGAEIDMRGYTHLGVYIVTDVNDSENATLKLLGKHTSEGTDEFELNGGTTQALWTTAASDAKVHYEFDVKGAPFIQLQAIAGTVGATAGDLTVYITKQFKN